MKTARRLCCDLLIKAENGAYSNLALDSALKECGLSSEDKRFVSRIFYGVIERRLTLEYVMGVYGSKPAAKLDKEVRAVLAAGIYQLLYCEGIPDRAAVNESAELIKQYGKASAAGYVNAVMRSMIRSGKSFELPEDKVKAISVKYSCSESIVSMLLKSYPEEKAVSLLEDSLTSRGTVFRVNTAKTDTETLRKELENIGISASPPALLPWLWNCLVSDGLSGNSLSGTELYKQGMFHIQGISSQLCCMALDPRENETIADVCAAPGGKSFTIAEMMNGTGTVYSGELHEKRTGLIRSGAERLGLKNIRTYTHNAAEYDETFPKADRVLCDVPCSGIGVMGSKPEIKYKDISDLSKLYSTQAAILDTSSRYVRSGGVLVYSTCTVDPAENDDIVRDFLGKHSDFYAEPFLKEYGEPFGGAMTTIFPCDLGSDGFFICRMRRK
ncbi:MAG: 16S rRNA (cytosine(967)-C(5))-methyltransferase RsmB [Oscillospiraceae bacterium]|nr:16S rRNA (cytosine(967)-C(5))-methyltransferase RsmB [Oscillospiraceae bacterium]